MKRPKKISISYYTNTKLKVDHDGQYPVYVRINYNGSNTKFRYIKAADFAIIPMRDHREGVIKDIDKTQIWNEHIIAFEKEIQNIIRYEDKISFNKKYSLKGLSNRYYFYDFPIESFLHESIVDSLNKYFSSKEETKDAGKYMGSILDKNLLYGFSLMEKQMPTLIDQMPAFLKNKIVTLIAIQLFEYSPYNYKKEDYLETTTRWYDFKFEGKNKQFLDFLKNWNWKDFDKKNSIPDYNKETFEEIKLLSQTFPIEPIEALSYLNVLEDLAYYHLKEYK